MVQIGLGFQLKNTFVRRRWIALRSIPGGRRFAVFDPFGPGFVVFVLSHVNRVPPAQIAKRLIAFRQTLAGTFAQSDVLAAAAGPSTLSFPPVRLLFRFVKSGFFSIAGFQTVAFTPPRLDFMVHGGIFVLFVDKCLCAGVD